MAITHSAERQYVLLAQVTVGFADYGATITTTPGESLDAITLPANSIVVGGSQVVDTAWDDTGPTGTFTVDVGDSASIDRYLNGVAVNTANDEDPIVTTGFLMTADTEIQYTVIANTGSLAFDTGSSRLFIQYTVAGRSNEIEG